MDRATELLERARAAAKAAKDIAEKAIAEGREMNDDERAQFDAKFAEANTLKADADAAKKDNEIIRQVKALSEELGEPGAGDDEPHLGGLPKDNGTRARAKSLGLTVVQSAEYKALMAPYLGKGHIPDRTAINSAPVHVKALLTGASSTSGGAFVVNERTDIVELLGRRTLSIRDAISVRRTTSDTVEYVRQTSHTNAAAPVAEATSSAAPTAPGGAGALVLAAGGGYKPEGSWAFEVVPQVVKTIAEWVPITKRALADVAQLEGLINDELRADLAETEETQMVNGDGTGENLEGILSVSGTQAQAFSTDMFETIRKGLTKVRTVGRATPTGVGLNPADVEAIDLARDAEDRFYGGGPFVGGPRTIWGYPMIESEAIPAGTAIPADWKKAVLWDREEATVTLSNSHPDFFIRNLVAVLGEERVAFGVTRPSAFVIADLTA